MTDVADRAERAGRRGELLAILGENMMRTARDAEMVQTTEDLHLLPDNCG